MADVFETLFAETKNNPDVKAGILVVIDELKKKTSDGLQQAEITEIATAIEAQLNSPAAKLAYSEETLATSRQLLNQMKSLPPQALAEMDSEEKANAFLDNFRAMLEAENAEEMRRKGDAVNQTAPNMVMSIIAMILVACGTDEKQVNQMLGLGEPPAADAQQAQTADAQQTTSTQTQSGAGIAPNPDNLDGLAHRLTNNPNGFTRAEKIIADGDDAKRHEALIAQRIQRSSKHLHDLMVKQPDTALASTIETRISQQSVTGEKDSRRSYYAAAAEHNALDTILNTSGGYTGNLSYAIEGLDIDNYDTIITDKGRAAQRMAARREEVSEDPALTYLGLEAKFDGDKPFSKGELNGAPRMEGDMNASQFAADARSFGQYAAEQQLLAALKQGVYHTYDIGIVNGKKAEMDKAVAAQEDKVKELLATRESLLARAGFHEAREELNKKLSERPEIGRGHLGYITTSKEYIHDRAEEAVAHHSSEKERLTKLANKKDVELTEALQNLRVLYRDQGEISQQLEYANGRGIMGEVKKVVDDVQKTIRDAKAEEEKVKAEAQKQKDRMDVIKKLGAGAPEAGEAQAQGGRVHGGARGSTGTSELDVARNELHIMQTQLAEKQDQLDDIEGGRRAINHGIRQAGHKNFVGRASSQQEAIDRGVESRAGNEAQRMGRADLNGYNERNGEREKLLRTEIMALKEEIKQREGKIALAEHEERNKPANMMKRHAERLEGAAAELVAKSFKQETEIDRLTRIAALNHENGATAKFLNTKLERTDSAHGRTEEQLAGLNTQLGKARAELEKVQALDELTTQIKDRRQEVARLNQQIEILGKSGAVLQSVQQVIATVAGQTASVVLDEKGTQDEYSVLTAREQLMQQAAAARRAGADQYAGKLDTTAEEMRKALADGELSAAEINKITTAMKSLSGAYDKVAEVSAARGKQDKIQDEIMDLQDKMKEITKAPDDGKSSSPRAPYPGGVIVHKDRDPSGRA